MRPAPLLSLSLHTFLQAIGCMTLSSGPLPLQKNAALMDSSFLHIVLGILYIDSKYIGKLVSATFNRIYLPPNDSSLPIQPIIVSPNFLITPFQSEALSGPFATSTMGKFPYLAPICSIWCPVSAVHVTPPVHFSES